MTLRFYRLRAGGVRLCFGLQGLQVFGQEVLLELRFRGEVKRADRTAEHRAALAGLAAAGVLL